MSLSTAYLTSQQDWRLAILAAALCLLAGLSGFSLLARSTVSHGLGRTGWTGGAALALGLGIWSAHVIAQLDAMAVWKLQHDIGQTTVTILLAVAIMAIGLGLIQAGFQQTDSSSAPGSASTSVSLLGSPKLGTRDRGSNALLGGIILGGGLAAMHYAGLAALQAPGKLVFNEMALVLSIGLMVACGIIASLILRRRDDFRHRAFAALCLALGSVCLQALTVMTTDIQLDHVLQVDDSRGVPAMIVLAPHDLAVWLGLASALLLLIGLAVAFVDQHLVGGHKLEAMRLRVSESRLRQLADATFEGIVLHRDGWIVDANATICTMLGLDLKQMIGHHLLEVVAECSQTKVKLHLATAQLLATDIAAGTDGTVSDTLGEPFEVNLRHADGTTLAVECLGRPLVGEESHLRAVAIRDISERKAAEERIRHMANHDALTGLPNRTLFQDRLAQAVARSKRGASTAAVLCLDLDRFKSVNDISGHAVGDELLRQVGQRLVQSIRGDDTVARLSGDEFAIIQVGVAHPDGPAILADRLVKVLAQPFEINNHPVVIGTSVGIALYPGDGEDDEELLRAADTALHRAKAAGRGTFRFFEAEMDVKLQERRWLERDLRQALATEQLSLHYQPLVDCGSIKVLGFEALTRWAHPKRGFISPADFIPLAEESGLIIPLGKWVLRQACRDAMTWPEDTLVAVNLSPAQFRQSDITSEIFRVLEETGLPAHRLELEITEGVLIEDTDRVLAILSELKAAGVRLSLDDFGTGYSSLSYLQRFPFDKIKIDRSFVWGMGENGGSMAIVRAVVALGRSLGITVTAEGVETQQQLDMLRAEQCDQAQGFLIGKPQPFVEASALLANPQVMMEKLRAAE